MAANGACKNFSAPYHDVVPIRSPIAVHDAILPFLRAKRVVEIGARAGDDFCCYARVAYSIVLFEIVHTYCAGIQGRCAQNFSSEIGEQWQRQAARTGRVEASPGAWTICASFEKTRTIVDADIYLWWIYPGLTSNPRLLVWLRQHLDAGRIRSSATAILMSDLGLAGVTGNPDQEDDLSRWSSYASWTFDVPFDESLDCEARDRRQARMHRRRIDCTRSKGMFRVMGVPISNLNYEILSRSVNASAPLTRRSPSTKKVNPGRVNEPNSLYF